MQLLSKFGVDPVFLAAQIVNFLVIFFILKKFLYKPIFEMLSKRKEAIETGLKHAEQMRLLLEKTQEKEKSILKEAQLQARKFVENAKKEAEEMMLQSKEKTKKETERMIDDAKAAIAEEVKKVEIKLSAQTAMLAVKFLEKSMQGLFTERDQKEIMERARKKISQKGEAH